MIFSCPAVPPVYAGVAPVGVATRWGDRLARVFTNLEEQKEPPPRIPLLEGTRQASMLLTQAACALEGSLLGPTGGDVSYFLICTSGSLADDTQRTQDSAQITSIHPFMGTFARAMTVDNNFLWTSLTLTF